MADGSTQPIERAANKPVSAAATAYIDERVDRAIAMGRPTLRTEALVAEICKELEAGRTLREICRAKHFPDRGTVQAWRAKDPDLHTRITLARARGCDALVEESLEIIDDSSNDYIDREVASGRIQRVVDSEHVQRSKLRAEHRLKIAALWNHAEYGAKSHLNVTGALTLEALVMASMGDKPAQPALDVTPTRAEIEHAPPEDGSDLV